VTLHFDALRELLRTAFTAERGAPVADVDATVVRSTAPKSVVYVAPHEGSPGVPGTIPRPTSVNSPVRMFALWPGLFIHAIVMLRGVARLPWPQARFSPTVQSPSGSM
jgi:hypothetical protein